jgi:hypothetical protein
LGLPAPFFFSPHFFVKNMYALFVSNFGTAHMLPIVLTHY